MVEATVDRSAVEALRLRRQPWAQLGEFGESIAVVGQAAVGVLEQRTDDLGGPHEGREATLAGLHERPRAAATLGGAGPAAAGTAGVGPAVGGHDGLDPHVMGPGGVEVVLVDEAFPHPEPEPAKGNLAGVVPEVDTALVSDPVVGPVDHETVEVVAFPAKGDLEDLMEVSDAGIGADQQAARVRKLLPSSHSAMQPRGSMGTPEWRAIV